MIAAKTLRAAEAHLKSADPIMAKLIAHYGPARLGTSQRDPFHVVCTSIIAQQLSVKAADTIQARVAAHLGAPVAGFTPAHYKNASVEGLRACGLSNAKSRWLIELAARAEDGRFNPVALQKLDDASLLKELDAIPGIGVWTAEMMLIFAFDRLDIFSLGDVALVRSVNQLYAPKAKDGSIKKLSEVQILKRCKAWSPYRSVASWYLWRATDGDNSWA